MKFDISSRGLTSLSDVEFPAGVTELDCDWNQLTSLDGCPASVTKLYCSVNKLTSLDGCPAGVTILCCGGNKLTSLDGCPAGVKIIDCYGNQIPESVVAEFRNTHPNCVVYA